MQGKTWVIPGKPVPWRRAGAQGKRRFTYPAQAAQMQAIRLLSGGGDPIPKGTPVVVRMAFYYNRPKNQRRANGELKDSAPAYHMVKPDIDNLEKLVLDSLSGVVYEDDAQVVQVFAQKGYTDGDERTTINIDILE